MVGHPVILRGLRLPGLKGEGQTPTTLSIAEQSFLPWFLSNLETPEGQGTLRKRDVNMRLNQKGQPRLFQPVHRSFNIVAVEVACEVEGQPRLDPKKIIGAGITLRRKVSAAEAKAALKNDVYRYYGEGVYGWMRQGGRVLGWRPVLSTPDNRFAPDPDPEFRTKAEQGRNARVLRRASGLQSSDSKYVEDFAPLVAAPDALCKKLGKTVLYGYLPVTSSERSEDDSSPAAPFDREVVEERLPFVLWSSARIKKTESAERPASPPTNTTVQTSATSNPSTSLQTLLTALTYLSQEPGLFLDPVGANDPVEELRKLLKAREVTLVGESKPTDFLTFLSKANTALIERNPEVSSIAMPVAWPDFSESAEADIIDAVYKAVGNRWSELSPGETRYQNMSARYELQAFVRVDRSDCGCPPQTVWTRPTGPVEIVPWYEGGEAPPPIIELPSPSALKGKISPNIAFKVPEEIQKFMSGLKLDKLMDGEQPSEKLGWGMICGFSIPIITICAFIVLQIFLVLFHILFWWLPFIRICIPFPKKENS